MKMSRKKNARKNRSHVHRMQSVGAAFYREDQWDRLVELSIDSEKLSENYQSWKETFEKTTRLLRDRGIKINSVQVDVEELNDWCQKRNIDLNGEARAQYAAELARKFVLKS